MSAPITKAHRLSVALADLGVAEFKDLPAHYKSWVDEPNLEGTTSWSVTRLAQLVADAEGAWIPCSERLPSKAGMYLCFHPRHGQDVIFFGGERWGTTSFWDHEDATHWMALPKPPEVK